MNSPHKQQLAELNLDPALNLLACVWSMAFSEAETQHTARQEIIEFFGLELTLSLYRRGCIAWDPAAVSMQLALEV